MRHVPFDYVEICAVSLMIKCKNSCQYTVIFILLCCYLVVRSAPFCTAWVPFVHLFTLHGGRHVDSWGVPHYWAWCY